MAKQTLKQALFLVTSGNSAALLRAAFSLDGKPAGEWPDTRQARAQMIDLLPARHARAYTADEFADAVLDLDESTGRYSTRSMAAIRERAGGLKAKAARVIPMRTRDAAVGVPTTPVGLCSRARAEYLMGAAALSGGAIYVSLQPIAGLTAPGEYLCCGTIGGEPVPTTLLDPQDVLGRLDAEAARLEQCSPTLFTDWVADIRDAAADLRAKLA